MAKEEKKGRDVNGILDKVRSARKKDQGKPRTTVPARKKSDPEPEPVAKSDGTVSGSQEVRKIKDLKFIERNRKAAKKDVEFYADTIKKAGLLVPIIIDEANNVLDGERRVRACKSLGWDEIPVIVTKKDFDPVSVITNFIRDNYTPEQVIERMEYMQKEYGFSQQKIALMCGVSQGRVSQLLGQAKEKKPAGTKSTGTNAGRIPASKLPHGVSVIVRKLTVDVTFKLDDGDMKNPAKAIADRFKEIKQFEAMVDNARKSL